MLTDSLILFYSLLSIAGFLVGIYGSFTGLGGVIILTPLLTIFFGLPYNTAIGCTLAQMIGMAVSGLVRHYRLGHVDMKLAVNFLAGSIPAAILGRYSLQYLTNLYGMEGQLKFAFDFFYGVFLVGGFVVMILKLHRFLRNYQAKRTKTQNRIRIQRPASRIIVVFIGGLGAGFLAGLFALGGGMVAIPILNGLLGVPIQIAVGTSVFQMIPMAISATWISFGTEDLNWTVIGFLLIGSIPGALIGPSLLARLLQKIDQKHIKTS